MKNFCVIFCLLATINIYAQGTKPVAKPVTKTTAPSIFKNSVDSASYAFGANIAVNLQQQGFDKVNTALLAKAMNDMYAKKKLALSQRDGNNAIQGLYQANQVKKYPALQQGRNFLAQNKKKPNIITLEDGLQYEILQKADSGTISPKPFDTVIVNYAGSLINGTEFENSFTSGRPAVFPANEVIPGWTEILQLMHVGDKYKVYIPSELAYHLNPRDPAVIPPGSALIFIMQLEGIKQNPNPPAMMPGMMGGQ